MDRGTDPLDRTDDVPVTGDYGGGCEGAGCRSAGVARLPALSGLLALAALARRRRT